MQTATLTLTLDQLTTLYNSVNRDCVNFLNKGQDAFVEDLEKLLDLIEDAQLADTSDDVLIERDPSVPFYNDTIEYDEDGCMIDPNEDNIFEEYLGP